MKETFADKAFDFYKNLSLSVKLPPDVALMNPYYVPAVQSYVGQFLKKFFSDTKYRVLVFGINPGRFGSGTTGVTFTDPVALSDFCGIENNLPRLRERSSEFVYAFIGTWGGPEKFHQDFFLTAVSPLGFTRKGVNYNYYDDPVLCAAVKPFIIETIGQQLACGANRKVAILLGTGKNQKFFAQLNDTYGFFKKLYVLPHPRFIMQYRRKQLPAYLKKYGEVFSQALSHS